MSMITIPSTIKTLKTCEASKNMHLWMLLVDNIIIFLWHWVNVTS